MSNSASFRRGWYAIEPHEMLLSGVCFDGATPNVRYTVDSILWPDRITVGLQAEVGLPPGTFVGSQEYLVDGVFAFRDQLKNVRDGGDDTAELLFNPLTIRVSRAKVGVREGLCVDGRFASSLDLVQRANWPKTIQRQLLIGEYDAPLQLNFAFLVSEFDPPALDSFIRQIDECEGYLSGLTEATLGGLLGAA